MSLDLTVGAHVDVFRRDHFGNLECVQTTRPCPSCGEPLTGMTSFIGDVQVHATCNKIQLFLPHLLIATKE